MNADNIYIFKQKRCVTCRLYIPAKEFEEHKYDCKRKAKIRKFILDFQRRR